MNNLFKCELYFRHREDAVDIYICLVRHEDGHYIVQQKEHIPRKAIDTTEIISHEISIRMLELFIQIDPNKRKRWYVSAEEAIKAHEKEFS